MLFRSETLGAFSLTFIPASCYSITMQTYPTVEDYIEVVAGAKDIITGKQTSTWFFGFQPIISLARYDVDVLASMFDSATNNKALTEKQGALACKILLKYNRQLAAKLIDVRPLENPVWRVPLRKMDYTQSLALEDERLVLRFPYNTKMIEELRSFKKDSQGLAEFDYDAKVWKIALTEYNLSWAYAWSQAKNFTIEPEVERLYNKILETEQTTYAIALTCTEDGLDITNCPDSLRGYIEEHLGGFGIDNITKLVDYSSVLGYTIDEFLTEALMKEFGIRFISLSTNNELRIMPESRTADDDLASVLDYAEKAERFPIVIYEPDTTDRLLNRVEIGRAHV